MQTWSYAEYCNTDLTNLLQRRYTVVRVAYRNRNSADKRGRVEEFRLEYWWGLFPSKRKTHTYKHTDTHTNQQNPAVQLNDLSTQDKSVDGAVKGKAF